MYMYILKLYCISLIKEEKYLIVSLPNYWSIILIFLHGSNYWNNFAGLQGNKSTPKINYNQLVANNQVQISSADFRL